MEKTDKPSRMMLSISPSSDQANYQKHISSVTEEGINAPSISNIQQRYRCQGINRCYSLYAIYAPL